MPADAQDLAVTNYQLVSQQTASPTKSNDTYRADLVNSGKALGSVTATLTSLDPFTIRVLPGQGVLNFTSVPANGQLTSGNTFTIEVDHTVPFDFSKLQWTFQTTAAPPVANGGPNQTVAVGSTVKLDARGSTNPSGIGTLTYSWRFTSRPPGTATTLFFADTVKAMFVADVQGTYVLAFTVTNGVASSSTTVTVMATLAGLPVITSVVPNTGQPGQTLQVGVVGQLTNFVNGTTVANFGAGITVNSTTIMDATHAAISITILGVATPGTRAVTMTTGTEAASLNNGFTVGSASQLTLITSASPPPNAAGWNNSSVIVTFTCSGGVNPVTCPPQATVGTEGAKQIISGTAKDGAGSVATKSVTLNIDRTPPLIAVTNPADNSATSTAQLAIAGTASDALSGLASVTCNGAAATLAGANFSCTVNLLPGLNTITAQASDVAGNTASASIRVTLNTGGAIPTISDFAPKSGPIGTLVNVTGTNFAPAPGAAPQLTLSGQSGVVLPVTLASFTNTGISFAIPAGAATGPLTVSVNSQSAISAVPLTITASSSFSISAAPGSADVIQGQSTTLAVSLASPSNFTQLTALSVTGLPGGVTAAFKPQQITAGQTAILTLTAPAGQATGTANLTITAAATVEGIPLTQNTAATLNVKPVTTSFLGRTVVDDPLQTPLAGITVKFLGKDATGKVTGCSGQTVSDGGGNSSLTNLPASCIGPQLIGYNGLTATAPPGKYAGVNLSYTLTSGQVTTSPLLIHLPRIDDKETVQVQQNAPTDQTFTFSTIPNLVVTVYAGTKFTLDDGSQPDPFPLIAVEVPVDRLPDSMPSSGMVMPFIVAFQPANAFASQPVAVAFPNMLNTPPGSSATLMTLDPTRGLMVPYGTGTVSTDGTQIAADPDPAHQGHGYGLIHFDWHGPALGPAPTKRSPGCIPSDISPGASSCTCATGGAYPIDLSSGLEVLTATNISVNGTRGSIAITRTYRTNYAVSGPFGVGSGHNYALRLDSRAPQNSALVNLIIDDGGGYPFARVETNPQLTNKTVPALAGAVMTTSASGQTTLRWKDGTVYTFQPGTFALGSVLTSITDPNGNTTTLTRNPSAPAQITQITDPVGRSLNLVYDGADRITVITDPIGRRVLYEYNSQGTLATVTDPMGGITHYAYDPQNRLTQIMDARDNIVARIAYDPVTGRATQQMQADGGAFSFQYFTQDETNPNSPILATVVTDPNGNQTYHRFDPSGFLLLVGDFYGQKRTFQRDPATNQVTAIAGTGACATCGAAAVGDQTFTYDANGNMTSRTDALNHTTYFVYDPQFSRLKSVTDALNNTTKLDYDPFGNLKSITDANSHTTNFTNQAGLITSITDPLNNKTNLGYDSFGNLVSIMDALGNVTQIQYDAVSRPIQTKDALGRTSSVNYDSLDRVSSVTNAKNGITGFIYDKNGNLLSVTDAKTHATQFTYDPLNRLSTRKDALGKSDARKYDLNGNLTQFVDRRGQTSTFTYDGLNRLTKEQYQDGDTVNRAYDATGRLLHVDDSASGSFDYTYDIVGALLSSAGPTGVVNYQRDALGRVASRQVVAQPKETYQYDPVGNLLAAAMPQAAVGYTYDERNLPKTMTRGNGVSTAYAFDPVGRLLSLMHAKGASVLSSIQYTLDPSGQRISQQLTSGQPLITQPAISGVDNGNRLLNRGASTYASDDNGNLTSESDPSGNTSYAWDSRGRLKSIQSSADTTNFVYDYAGNMLRMTQNRITTSYVMDSLTNVVSLSTSTGGQASVLGGNDLDSAYATLRSAGDVEYALVDGLDSTVATTDGNGTIRGQSMYEPFGQTSTSGGAFPFGYTGRVPILPELYYYRTRFYSSQTGSVID